MYVVKGGKEKGRRKETLPAMRTASRSVKKRGNKPTARREKKKERKPQAMGTKKRTTKEKKKEKGATSYGKSSKCAPLGGCTLSRKLQEENCTKVLGVSSGLTTWDRPVLWYPSSYVWWTICSCVTSGLNITGQRWPPVLSELNGVRSSGLCFWVPVRHTEDKAPGRHLAPDTEHTDG